MQVVGIAVIALSIACGVIYRTAVSVGKLAGEWKVDPVALAKDSVDVSYAHSRRTDLIIQGGKELLHAWLFLPTSTTTPPVVVMGHGLGAQKDFGLDKFADAFAAKGIASVVIDYRRFGGSGGSPRNLIWPWNHVQDLIDTVLYVKSGAVKGVDAERVALWGGHVITAGAELGDQIKCIISQVPHLDGKEASKRNMKLRGLKGVLQIACVSVVDWVRHFLSLKPLYVRIVGLKDDLVSYMPLEPNDYDQYFAKHPKPGQYLGAWRNMAPARTLPLMAFYNPGKRVQTVHAPIMFVSATRDSLCPVEPVREAYNKSANSSKLLELDTTHFEIYLEPVVEKLLAEQVAFLEAHLKA